MVVPLMDTAKVLCGPATHTTVTTMHVVGRLKHMACVPMVVLVGAAVADMPLMPAMLHIW